jgi:hypothetical protein
MNMQLPETTVDKLAQGCPTVGHALLRCRERTVLNRVEGIIWSGTTQIVGIAILHKRYFQIVQKKLLSTYIVCTKAGTSGSVQL